MPVRLHTPFVPFLLAVGLVLALTVTLTGVLLTATTDRADAGSRHQTRWDCLAHYESTHRWAVNTGNGHYGGLQFSLSTWQYYGGPNYSRNAMPHKATRREQIKIAKRVAWRGWNGHRPQGGGSAWPNTWYRCF